MMRRPLTGGIPRLDPLAAEQGQDWGFTFNLRTNAPGLIDQDCYGHSGWPGTEFWVHPSAGIAWVLLTNRVHPSREWGSNNRARQAFAQGMARALAA